MYRLSNAEIMYYKMATAQLEKLRHEHAVELQNAYEDIHPTITRVDYGIGTMYAESIDPADYAIYLIELREEHEQVEKWWSLRADAYADALGRLTVEDRNNLSHHKPGGYALNKRAQERLEDALRDVVAARPELHHKATPVMDDMQEMDAIIDNMNDKELFENYWDLDEQLEAEGLSERCVKLFSVHDMTYKETSELTGVTVARVKGYVMQK